jgi:hypothetical protein
MTDITEEMLATAHKIAFKNRIIIETGMACGCFSCGKTFVRTAIVEWVDDDLTPVCPFCHIDAVLGEHQGFPLTEEFLTAMYNRYFTVK